MLVKSPAETHQWKLFCETGCPPCSPTELVMRNTFQSRNIIRTASALAVLGACSDQICTLEAGVETIGGFEVSGLAGLSWVGETVAGSSSRGLQGLAAW